MAGFGPLSHFAVSTGTSAMECMAVQIITDERGEPHKKVERIASAGAFIRPIGLGIPEIPYAIQWVAFKGF